MPCEIKNREQRLDDFLLGKLSPPEAEALEIHVFGCAECLEELRLREQMIALIKDERVTAAAQPAERQPTPLLQTIREFFRAQPDRWIYAGAVAALLIGLVLTQLFRRAAAPEIDMANFAELPHLESRAGQTLRSGEFSLSILAPQIGENFNREIEFRWEAKKDGEAFQGPVELRILNNREAAFHTAAVVNGKYILTEKLAPGLYYWTLSENNETLYIGKFFVNKSTK